MSPSLVLAIGLLALFLGVVVALLALGASASDRAQVGRSLAALEAMQPWRDRVQRDIDRPFNERVISPIVSRLGQLGRAFSPRDETTRLRHKLERAGNPARWDVERVLAFKVLGLVTHGERPLARRCRRRGHHGRCGAAHPAWLLYP